MNLKLRTQGKKILSKILPDSMRLRHLSHLPKLETLLKTHSEQYPTFNDRYKLYDYINNTILNNGPIEYCEFGVFKGDSIKYWTDINANINSKFYGFDTFTGLPEVWDCFTAPMEKNHFDAGGNYPAINDKRVSFIKGLFQDALPEFLKTRKFSHPLIIHNDSDLYSATLYVLTYANGIIVPGTIIMFDEFSTMLHEFRALEDYCSSYMRNYEIIGATLSSSKYYTQIAIKMT